jgi:hypothetical protein
MRPRPGFADPTPPQRPGRAIAGVANVLLATGLMVALTACASVDYADKDFAGTFEDEDGNMIVLAEDATGTLTGFDDDAIEPGTWDLVESDMSTDFIMFFYEEPEPQIGSGANIQIWIDSKDELYLLPDGPDGSRRIDFERIEGE